MGSRAAGVRFFLRFFRSGRKIEIDSRVVYIIELIIPVNYKIKDVALLMRKKLSLIVSLVMILSLLLPGSMGALAEGGQQADSAETAANTGSETTADAPAPAAGLATPRI